MPQLLLLTTVSFLGKNLLARPTENIEEYLEFVQRNLAVLTIEDIFQKIKIDCVNTHGGNIKHILACVTCSFNRLYHKY